MRRYKQLILSFAMVLLLGKLAAANVEATIDATRQGQPITKLIFGGFMEPATTGVWSEMLSHRKFFNETTSNPPAMELRDEAAIRKFAYELCQTLKEQCNLL